MWTHELEADIDAPRRARELTALTLGEHLDDPVVEVAKLIVSELVTNVLIHTEGSDVCLRLSVGDRLRIEVANVGEPFDPASDREDRHGGWGLQIVEALSDRWGISPTSPVCVWSELAVAPGSA